jgi:aryl-alcohol dehydrogenase-like predicted oxidoreductase
MKYRQLGRTGLKVSPLCLGCMSYGSPTWRPWILEERDALPFFKKAIEAGINFFDTADMYSLGVSEQVTGRALRELARLDEVVIATKVFFATREGPNMTGLGRKHVVQACEASLKRLGVETIDLYQLHRFDPSTPIEETLAALEQLVQQGKVRYLGSSSTHAWKLARALGVSERHGWARFVSLQNHYNLLYREEEREMLPLCQAEGLGVIPWSPLARGRLARPRGERQTARAGSDGLADQLYDQPGDDDVIDALAQVAARRGVQMAEVALAWLLGRPAVVAPIVGATKLEHLDSALRALELQLTDEEVRLLEAPYRPHAERGWL